MSVWSALWHLFSRPAPKPPVAPARAIGLTVRDATTTLGVSTARGTLTPLGAGPQIIASNAGGRLSFYGVPNLQTPMLLQVSADGYQTYGQKYDTGVPSLLPELLLTPLAPPVPALVVQGAWFVQADGSRYFGLEASSFQAYQKFLDGNLLGLTATFGQLRDVGFNAIRVFGMARNLFNFDPANYPKYVESLPAFVRFAASFGLRTDFVVFPDCALVLPDTDAQLTLWANVGAALQPVANSVLVSLQNEADQVPNKINTDAFAPLAGLLCSHGSNGSQSWPVEPHWDWSELHLNDASEWWRKPHNAIEIAGCCALTEITRPDRDPILAHHEDAARCAKLLNPWYCFHSTEGRTSDVLTGLNLDCAQAVVTGARSIPLSCQLGGYRHPIEEETPDLLRFYRRGTDPACAAPIRK